MKTYVLAILLCELIAVFLLLLSTWRAENTEVWFPLLNGIEVKRIEAITGLTFNEAFTASLLSGSNHRLNVGQDPIYRKATKLASNASMLAFFYRCLEGSVNYLVPAPLVAIVLTKSIQKLQRSQFWQACKRDIPTPSTIHPASCTIYLCAVGTLLLPFVAFVLTVAFCSIHR